MRISSVIELPSVKILLFIHEKGEVRYTDLTRLLSSRGTLSMNLRELEDEGIVKRRVVASKPIQAYYSLTEKGRKIAELFGQIKKVV